MARLFSLTPLAWAVGLTFGAHSAHASELSLGSTDLFCRSSKLQEQQAKQTVVKTSGEAALPADYTRVTADKVQGQTQVQVQAQGDVIIERNQQVLNADWAHYDQKIDTVTAGDQFVLSDEGSVVEGEKLVYQLGQGSGSTQNARVATEQEGRRLQAVSQTAELQNKKRYTLKEVKFNTCQAGDASWYIQANSIDADYEKGIGVAKQAKLVFGGVPVLYTPWADFPLNGNRKSGLLVPTLKIGSDGTEVDIPYYFNLAPNYDATARAGVITSRGVKLGGEFRYLQPKYHGAVSGTWLPNDQRSQYNNRAQVTWQHQQQFTEQLNGGVDFNQVSDDDYYRDFYGQSDIASNVNLNRQAWLNHTTQLWGAPLESRAEVQKYQTLANASGYKDRPYAIMPRLSSRWQKNVGDHQIDIWGQFTRFTHDSKQAGNRLVLYPSVSRDFYNHWGYVRPKVGVHYTHYNLDAFNTLPSRTASRVLPILNVDAGMTFERESRFLGQDNYVQTLEPRLFYNYIPTKSQNDLPNLDASENSFSYEQLFRENLYSGNDRINSSNSLTTAVQTRFLAKSNGAERFRAGIGQKFYFTTDSVKLDGSVSQNARNRSDWIAFGQGKLNDQVSAYASTHYNQNQERFENIAAGVQYHPEAGKVISARYKYGRNKRIYLQSNGEYYYDKLRQIDVGAQWPLNPNLYAVARLNYSLDASRPLDQLLGLEYKSQCGCWSASMVAQRYVTGLENNNQSSTYKNAVFFTLQLKDLSNIGNNPTEPLRLAIPDYSKTNEVVKK